MTHPRPTGAAPATGIVDRDFLPNRYRLLDIAAFLDRIDRSTPAGKGSDDYRVVAFRRAVAELSNPVPGRTERILRIFSDPGTGARASAPGPGGATGAYGGEG